ncbi:Os06g0202800, partial [Oryza sativa Japonica Group]
RRTKRLKRCHQQPFKQSRAKVQFADLPEDLLCTIFSKIATEGCCEDQCFVKKLEAHVDLLHKTKIRWCYGIQG